MGASIGSPRLDPQSISQRVPGEVVVRYAASADRADGAELRDEIEAKDVDHLALTRTEVLDVANGTVSEAIATLESSPDVAFAEPNFYYRATATPNDPRFGQEWGLNNTGQTVAGISGTSDADIDAPEAWGASTGSRDVVVAVIDTGVDYLHPDLAANIWTNPGESGGGRDKNGVDDDGNGFVDDWRGWDFVQSDNKPRDLLGHGTHVAGIIGAVGDNGYGATGVNWHVSLMPVRVLDADGVGTTADVADAITYAAEAGADVINLSLEGPNYSLTVGRAIDAAPNVLIAAAAGNAGSNNDISPSYPCSYPSQTIVCVAATDQFDRLAGYSNYGVLSVDLAAPGTSVVSTLPPLVGVYQEGFEADISSTWLTGGSGTTWGRKNDRFGSFVTDSPTGSYQPSSDTWLRSAFPTNLAGLNDCQLSYVYSLDTAVLDNFYVEVSSDGTTWSQVASETGSTGGSWLSSVEDISAFDGASVYLRFRLTSNAALEADGVSLDDIRIRCLSVSYSGNEFGYYSGTSMATPHVAGAAALVWSLAPAASVATIRDALLSGVDTSAELAGKIVTSGRLDVAKALAIVVPVADPGPTPSPTPTASVAPVPTPTPSTTAPTEDPILYHLRAVTLSLRGHLRVNGRVTVPDGYSECAAHVIVKVKRWSKVITRVETGAEGRFHALLPDRGGRYTARAIRRSTPGYVCKRAISVARYHH